MSAVRTQIYLSPDLRRRLDEYTDATGESLAQVVRRALDSYLNARQPSAQAALEATFGADPQAAAPSRGEWERG